jgi:hypothetical protein
MYPTSYHNTNNEHGAVLQRSEQKAQTQEEIILAFFMRNAGKAYTPEEVHRAVNLPMVPITSIRRAISNLTNRGHLVKTQEQRTGAYGKMIACWRLVSQFGQLELGL